MSVLIKIISAYAAELFASSHVSRRALPLSFVIGFSLMLGACVDVATTNPDGGSGNSGDTRLPTVSLSATPESVPMGASVTLTWAATDATTCAASGAWNGTKLISGTAVLPSVTSSETYTLTCVGSGGSGNASVGVTVEAPPAMPVVTLGVSSTSIAYNGAATFTWSSSNATSCTASNAWSGSKDLAGEQTLSALTNTGTYALTCAGPGGSTTQSITVTVAATSAPTISLTSSSTTIVYNGSATLSWSTVNATSCTAGGAWSGEKTTSGTQTLAALITSGTYTLSCSGAGGSSSQSVTFTVQAAVSPTVTLTASPLSVAYSGSSTLSWSSSNATSCVASGAWSGNKATSGTQILSALTTSGTYTLSCSGAGGSNSQSVTLTVQAAVAPTVTLTANPTSVAYNGSSTLSWSSSNATSCVASGAWSGTKSVSGNEPRTSLTSTGVYTLSCTGAGGTTSQSVTVTVVSGTTGAVNGSVDSSRINRSGVNKVYLYSGTVTPDDYDGDSGDPIASALVTQENNACTFSYEFSGVAPGSYTIAFTNQAASDTAGVNDAINYIGTANITVASTFTQNFGAARVLKVGSGKTYAKPSAAYAAAVSGDVIEIDAGVYQNDVVVWRQNNLTLRGVGGRAHMQGTQIIPYTSGVDTQNGVALWVTNGSGIVVENIEFSGAQVPDENGAGIRANGNGLTVCNGYFHDNENGILGGAGEVLIEYSEFNHNGFGDGYTHNLYMDTAVTRFVFRHNYSHRAIIGHELKSRAAENHILYNRLMNEEGNASYTIDLPNGGLSYIIGNLLQQGTNTDNGSMISYGAEGLLAGRTHKLYLVNNTLVNDRSAGGTFISAASGTSAIQVTNNLFIGAGTDVSGPSVTKVTNLLGSSSDLANRAEYNYHPTSMSLAINQGSDPGIVNGFDLRPMYQYLDSANRSVRLSTGSYDIGAYEYAP